MPQHQGPHPLVEAYSFWEKVETDDRYKAFNENRKYAVKLGYWKKYIADEPDIKALFDENPKQAADEFKGFMGPEMEQARRISTPQPESPPPTQALLTGSKTMAARGMRAHVKEFPAKIPFAELRAEAQVPVIKRVLGKSLQEFADSVLVGAGDIQTVNITVPQPYGPGGTIPDIQTLLKGHNLLEKPDITGLAPGTVVPVKVMGGGMTQAVKDSVDLATGLIGFFGSPEGLAAAAISVVGGPLGAGAVAAFYASENAVESYHAIVEWAKDPTNPDKMQAALTTAGFVALLSSGAMKGVKTFQQTGASWKAAWHVYNEKFPAKNAEQMIARLKASEAGEPPPDIITKEAVEGAELAQHVSMVETGEALEALRVPPNVPFNSLSPTEQLRRRQEQLASGKYSARTRRNFEGDIRRLERLARGEEPIGPGDVSREYVEESKQVTEETKQLVGEVEGLRTVRQTESFQKIDELVGTLARLRARVGFRLPGRGGRKVQDRVPVEKLNELIGSGETALGKEIIDYLRRGDANDAETLMAEFSERGAIFAAEAQAVRDLIPLSQKGAALRNALDAVEKALPKRQKGAAPSATQDALMRLRRILGDETRLIVDKLGRKPLTAAEILAHEDAWQFLTKELQDPKHRSVEVETQVMRGGKIVKVKSKIQGVAGPEFNRLFQLLTEYLTLREEVKRPGRTGMPEFATLPRLNTELAKTVLGRKGLDRNLRPSDYEELADTYGLRGSMYRSLLPTIEREARKVQFGEEPRRLTAEDKPRGKVPEQIKDVDVGAEIDALVKTVETPGEATIELIEPGRPTGKGQAAGTASVEELARVKKSHIHVTKEGKTSYTGVSPDYSERLPAGPEGTVTFAREPGTTNYKVVGGKPTELQKDAFFKMAGEQFKGERRFIIEEAERTPKSKDKLLDEQLRREAGLRPPEPQKMVFGFPIETPKTKIDTIRSAREWYRERLDAPELVDKAIALPDDQLAVPLGGSRKSGFVFFRNLKQRQEALRLIQNRPGFERARIESDAVGHIVIWGDSLVSSKLGHAELGRQLGYTDASIAEFLLRIEEPSVTQMKGLEGVEFKAEVAKPKGAKRIARKQKVFVQSVKELAAEIARRQKAGDDFPSTIYFDRIFQEVPETLMKDPSRRSPFQEALVLLDKALETDVIKYDSLLQAVDRVNKQGRFAPSRFKGPEGERGSIRLGKEEVPHKHLPNLEDPDVAFRRAREKALEVREFSAGEVSFESGWLAPDRSWGVAAPRNVTHGAVLAKITGQENIKVKLPSGISPRRMEIIYRENLEVSAMRSGYIRKTDYGIYAFDRIQNTRAMQAIVDDIVADSGRFTGGQKTGILVEWRKNFDPPTVDHPFATWETAEFTFSELEVYNFDLKRLIHRQQMLAREGGYLKITKPKWVEEFKRGIREMRVLPGELKGEAVERFKRSTLKSEDLKSLNQFMRANEALVTDFSRQPDVAEYLSDPQNMAAYKAIEKGFRDPAFLEMRNAEEFTTYLQNMGTNLDQFSKILSLTMNEWGLIGIRWNQYVQFLKEIGVDIKKRPEKIGWYERGIEGIRRADDVRRAALISQFVTAFRNATVQVPVTLTRIGTEAIAGVIDAATRRILYGPMWEAIDGAGNVVNGFLSKEQAVKIGKRHPDYTIQPVKESPFIGFAHSISLFESLAKQTARTLMHPLKNPKPEMQLGFLDKEVSQVLQKFPRETTHMFSFVDPDIKGLGTYGTTVGRLISGLTYMNRWQEFLFRRVYAESIIRADLIRHGITLDGIDQVPKHKLKDIVIPAIDEALRLTFAEGASSETGKILLKGYDALRPITTAIHPFARFAVNSAKYVGRHSPFGIVLPSYTIKIKNLLKSGNPKDVMTASRMVSQSIVGTTFIYAGYQLATSAYAGPKWYKFYDPETKKELIDIRPYMPFALYLYFGHVMKKSMATAAMVQESRKKEGKETSPIQYGVDEIAALGAELTSGDALEALVSMNRLAGSGLIFIELFLNGDRILPRDPVEKRKELDTLGKEFFGSYFGGFTTPARMLRDFYALWNLDDREYQSSRTDPFVGNLVRNFPTDWQEYLGHKLPLAPSPTGSMRLNPETGKMEPSGFAATPEPLGPLPGTTGRQLTSYVSKPRDIVRYEIDRLVQEEIGQYRSYFPPKTGNRVLDEIKIRYFGQWMQAWGKGMIDNPLFAEMDGETRHLWMQNVSRMGRQWANMQTFAEVNRIAKEKGLPPIPYPQILSRTEMRKMRELGIGEPELTTQDIVESQEDIP